MLPDLIVGDFDSHPVPHLPVETIRLPREKDDTDTMFAAREAQRRGFSEVLLLGAIGRRLDHSLGNVAILYWLAAQGMVGTIWDDYSELELVGQTGASVPDSYPYFSLLSPWRHGQGRHHPPRQVSPGGRGNPLGLPVWREQ